MSSNFMAHNPCLENSAKKKVITQQLPNPSGASVQYSTTCVTLKLFPAQIRILGSTGWVLALPVTIGWKHSIIYCAPPHLT